MMKQKLASHTVMVAAMAASGLVAAPHAVAQEGKLQRVLKEAVSKSAVLDDRELAAQHRPSDRDADRSRDDDRQGDRGRDAGRDNAEWRDDGRDQARDHKRDDDHRRGGDHADGWGHSDWKSGRNGRGKTARVECGSSDYKSNTCRLRVGFRIEDARVVKQRSHADCDRGDSWRLNGNSIYVRDGCRAIFEVSSVRFHARNNESRHNVWDQAGRHGRHDFERVHMREQRSAVSSCEREAHLIARKNGRYGAAYASYPRVSEGPYGAIVVRGEVKTWGKHGPHYVSTRCRVKYGSVVDFDIRR